MSLRSMARIHSCSQIPLLERSHPSILRRAVLHTFAIFVEACAFLADDVAFTSAFVTVPPVLGPVAIIGLSAQLITRIRVAYTICPVSEET